MTTATPPFDVKRSHRELYTAPTTDFVEVLVPAMTHLAIDGHGDPNTSPTYVEAVSALYTVAYAVRAAFKVRTGTPFVVGPLEGLWSSDDPTTFVTRHKDLWDWTMLIPLPEAVTAEDLQLGAASARTRVAKTKLTLPVDHVAPRTLTEGRCLQILHIGSYDAEAATLHRLHHDVMPGRGVTWNGPHHEIYLSDPRRTPPERLKTILRQPVRPIR